MEEEENRLLGAPNRYAIRLADHQRSRQVMRDGTTRGGKGLQHLNFLIWIEVLKETILRSCNVLVSPTQKRQATMHHVAALCSLASTTLNYQHNSLPGRHPQISQLQIKTDTHNLQFPIKSRILGTMNCQNTTVLTSDVSLFDTKITICFHLHRNAHPYSCKSGTYILVILT